MAADVVLIVSCYNRPRLLGDALESVRQQVGLAPEQVLTLVMDDSSERLSEIAGVVARHQAEGHHAQLISTGAVIYEEALRGGGRCAVGINEALHRLGTALPAPKAVAFLPDDDWLFPESLATRFEALQLHPKLTAVYGRLEACHGLDPHLGVHYPLGQSGGRFGERWHGRDGHIHDRASFWADGTVPRVANCVDHGMLMVRWRPDLPLWPTRTLFEHIHPREPWRLSESEEPGGGGWSLGEVYRCPDAGWLARLEHAGMGPFLGVDGMAVMKRYHMRNYRTDEGWTA